MTALVAVTAPGDQLARYAAAFLTTWGPNTRRTYRYAIQAWLDWCTANNVDPFNAVPAHGQLWDAHMRDTQGYTEGTRANRLSAVRSLYEWLETQDVAFRRNPAKLTRNQRPQPNPKPTSALSAEQAVALLDAADNDTPRTAAMVWLLITTGIRVGELVSADLEDLDLDAGHRILHVMGKGRKRRKALITPPTWQRIDAYRATRDDATNLPTLHAGARPRRPLLATSTGRRVGANRVTLTLQRLARDVLPPEVARQISPHVTRATYVTLNLAAGKDLRQVQYAVGHANPTTTEGYDRSQLNPDNHPSYALMSVLSAARANR
ncbi:tyrosine-type recombinase/integrase [Micromonospora sp. L32]|uniref:tyrosine-type recombinase/integrase n=1 Tax=Micromonospora sp. L32 TaxID=3452214 RepID=UPI003F89121C